MLRRKLIILKLFEEKILPLQRLSIKSALLEDENEEETTNYYLKPNLWRKKMFRMQLLMPKLLEERILSTKG